MPQPGRRIYAYLRWNANGTTNERYVGEVSGLSRQEFLTDAWRQVTDRRLLPLSPSTAQSASSWATSPAVRKVMQANVRRDTKPERELRSILHGMGLRYRVDFPPLPATRCRADVVFSRAKLAVFVDGCFWHGCPVHYRPAKKNAGFWDRKLAENVARDRRTDDALRRAGWRSLRVWEHDDMYMVAARIAEDLHGV